MSLTSTLTFFKSRLVEITSCAETFSPIQAVRFMIATGVTDAGNSLLYRTSVLPHAMIGLVTFVHLEASVATGFGSSS